MGMRSGERKRTRPHRDTRWWTRRHILCGLHSWYGILPQPTLFYHFGGTPRAAQWRFAWWQEKAGFDRRYNFHCLRHSSVTNVYRATKDLFLAQRFARHASPLTTIVYTHPADEELWEGIRNLPC